MFIMYIIDVNIKFISYPKNRLSPVFSSNSLIFPDISKFAKFPVFPCSDFCHDVPGSVVTLLGYTDHIHHLVGKCRISVW